MDITEVVGRAMSPFPADQITRGGAPIEISPQQTLALYLALHELATNAAKYGALSRPEGRVELRWDAQNDMLNLSWRESGGPPVVSPSRRGFGSRLLEDALFRDLGGKTRLEFLAGGVCCSITAALVAEDR